jgi:hypothetical protein
VSPGPRRLAPRGLVAETVAALAIALVAAVVLTWPLATGLGHEARDGVDPRFEAWVIDWVQHEALHPGRWFDANLFAPEPGTLAYSDPLLGLALPLLPLRWLGLTPMAVHNVALLLGFATSAAAGYLAGRYVVGSVGAGAVTAAACGFGPFPTFESNHVQIVAHAGIPLAVVGAWWLCQRRAVGAVGRSLVGPAVALAAVVVWQVSVSFYTGAYAGLAALCVLGARWRSLGRSGTVAALAALAVAGAVALVLAMPYLDRASALPDFERSLGDLRGQGADVVGTDPRLVVWGPLLGVGRDQWPTFSAPGFPGLVLVLLAPWGWWTARRTDGRAVARVGLVLVVVGLVFALGTSDEGWRQFAPYRLVFELVPGFGGLRATVRAVLVALPGLGLLAGLAVDDLAGRVAARRAARATAAAAPNPARVPLGAALGVAAAAVLWCEGFAPWTDLADTRTQAVDEALADIPEPGGVVYLPLPPPTEPGVLAQDDFAQALIAYRTTAHHRPTPNGFSGYHPPSYFAMKAAMATFPDAASLALLAEAGVVFVVVDPEAVGTPWEPLLVDGGSTLERVGDYDGSVLYRLAVVPG